MTGTFDRIAVACAMIAIVTSGVPAVAKAQALIQHQMHRSATFEMHSVHDDVQLYEGEPQYLLRIDVRPERSLLPKVDFSNNNQVVVLRVRDLATFEPAERDSARLADDAALGIEEDPDEREAVSQDWKVELAPSSPVDFLLHAEGGKNLYDFTDIPVQSVHLLADTTDVRVEFNRPNLAALSRFKLTARVSRIDFSGFGNARARSTTLHVDETDCEIDLSGNYGDGIFELFFEGVPTKMRLTLPRGVAYHIEGPASTVGRFDRDGMSIVGSALEDSGYAERKTRLRLHFSRDIPKLEIRWKDGG